jgi:hypothetical protein
MAAISASGIELGAPARRRRPTTSAYCSLDPLSKDSPGPLNVAPTRVSLSADGALRLAGAITRLFDETSFPTRLRDRTAGWRGLLADCCGLTAS